MAPILRRYGYSHMSGMFIKTDGEIAVLVDIHKYTTCDMIDIDIGVGPWQHCYAWPPQGSGDLGVRIATRQINQLRDHPFFLMLSDAIAPLPEEVDQATVELAEWVDKTVLDAARLRTLILDDCSFLNYP